MPPYSSPDEEVARTFRMPTGGGLLQLVAQGKQDLYLTGNPQITWFKMVYRRYTNFAMEAQSIYFDGDPDFGKRLTAKIPRRGDLLGPMILEVVLPAVTLTDGTTATYVQSIGHALLEELVLEIGEQEIDRQTGEWMQMWSQVSIPPGLRDGFKEMVGDVEGGQNLPAISQPTCSTGTTQYGALKLYIPLQFWFNKNPGLYLPLLAMQYHEVRLNVKLRALNQLVEGNLNLACGAAQVNPTKIVDIRLYGDYVFLDTEERRRFVANTHEYLIEQIQYTPEISLDANVNIHNIRLEFNHPLREIFWRIQRDKMKTLHQWFNYGSVAETSSVPANNEQGRSQHMLESALIQVDGFDRFEVRDAGYFSMVQPFQYHTQIPLKKFFYMYSFCLRPEEMQPSGSLNASRIDNLVMQIYLRPDTSLPLTNPNYQPNRGPSTFRAYAKNHNVLRVVNGFAGLLFKI